MISNSAHITPGAVIGNDVTIDPFAYIAADVVIGDRTWVGPGAVILDGARIGKDCKIFPSSVVSGIPQDVKFRGEITTAEIGDNTIIREGVTVNRGTVTTGKTVVGNNCLLMAYAHVGHDCIIGNNCIIGNACGLAGEVRIDDWAILSGAVLVHQFSRIGGHVIIGGGSKVRTDVPPFIKADRDPLCFMGLNTVGLNRRNFSKERIDEIHNIYRIIYQSKRNTTQALEYVENEFRPSPDRDYILNFIRDSGRGIIRGPR
ncbi:MAG TPA: acyl-ACP--UDP-N-acetylglucosamine O-acyltransferase [Bacteroidales bacterium]|jgi:UDP-N-acetylglucosamine acyltransferase|nr:acyl-ACP--UDP-N-acetylglucosamine O-acyltransferase [Bacteroidales bacterium]HOS70933.1 acyl-ACP--UDP-N-acetylglucosamine O-acyltransferase [Bacteroidales bacterium]HQH25158.1 acyl-ACP--UDP-N-acetylglucosamine O-acyltransferase [Bacteroidales bacterium]HQJ82386.1 acyl-ACP--UDP-N-acetylglucosamine O-acyltransferase [Bacteroidales bacterium]